LLGARGAGAALARHRRGARHPDRRGGTGGRGGGAHEGRVSALGTTLVFDIETVPDVELGRRLYALGDLADGEVAKAMFALRRQDTGGDFLSLEQHRGVAISSALRTGGGRTLWGLR